MSLVRRALAAALLAAGGLLAAGCDNGREPAAAKIGPTTAPVRVGTVTQETVPVVVRAIGWVEPLASVTVRPQVEGQLKQVHFAEGQHVKANDLLFTIDPRPFEAALRLVEANLARDQAMAREAQREFERVKELFGRGLASDREMNAAQADADAKAAQAAADEAQIENARLRLEYCTIRAPIEGRAGSVLVKAGNIVEANATDLVVLNQIDPIYVAFSVAEKHLAQIKGQQGEIAVDARLTGDDGPALHGTLAFIDNEVDRSTGMVRLKARFDNAERRLWPGGFVNVTIAVRTLPDALVAPSSAVQTGQEGNFVFVVQGDDTVAMRYVHVRVAIDDRTVLDDGVQPGDVVVTDGHLRLSDGAKVVVRDEARAAPKVAAATSTSQPAAGGGASGPSAAPGADAP